MSKLFCAPGKMVKNFYKQTPKPCGKEWAEIGLDPVY